MGTGPTAGPVVAWGQDLSGGEYGPGGLTSPLKAALGHDVMGMLKSAGMSPWAPCPDDALGLWGERTTCRGGGGGGKRPGGRDFCVPQLLPWVTPATLPPSIPAKGHRGCGEPRDSHSSICLYLTPINPTSPPLAPNSMPTFPWKRSQEMRALHGSCPAPGHVGGGPLAGGSSLPSKAWG